jgi:hypothetical protein
MVFAAADDVDTDLLLKQIGRRRYFKSVLFG